MLGCVGLAGLESTMDLGAVLVIEGRALFGVKGISAAARAAKASRFGLKILEALEKVPALKRLLDAFRGASRLRVAAEFDRGYKR
jgi:hypothetical protein